MTTERQRKANQESAKRSTGPRTASGKSISSKNARKHGLCGEVNYDALVSWYRVILNSVEATPDPLELDPYYQSAVELARAEEHLQRVRAAEERWFTSPAAPVDLMDTEIDAILKQLYDAATTFDLDPIDTAIMQVRVTRIQAREHRRRQKSYEKMGRALMRYRAEAEARRGKALARWIDQKVLSHRPK